MMTSQQASSVVDSQQRDLSVDLNHAVQKIPDIIFAVPNPDGSRRVSTQVKVGATTSTLQINGSLVTNANQTNKVSNIASGTNFSLIGGQGNAMSGAIGESTIIGGSGNRVTAPMSLIAGGEGNIISGGNRSTIL
jgi:hypothetical protein